MEAHIVEIDEQIKQTDTIKELQERDEEIVKDLEGLKEGQEKINEKVDTGFEKGRKRMDGIEGDLKNLTQMLTNSDKKRDEQHGAILNKITDNEIVRLEKKLAERDKLIEKKDTKDWDVTKIILGGISLIVVTAYLVGVGLK